MGPYAKQAAARSGRQALVPAAVVSDSDTDEYRVFYDVATKTAWVLWLVAGREGRRSFGTAYVANLGFEVGDVVNGMYKVLGRDGNVVVFGMAQGAVEGRLVVSIGDERERLDASTGAWVAVAQTEGDGQGMAVVKNETFMWVRRAEGVVMPLERRVPRWLHEVASWWLMDEGTKWLAGTEGK
ncbi:hypothetical protein DV737_g4595, partial [Chaetothyriales sp. CBS 132003]